MVNEIFQVWQSTVENMFADLFKGDIAGFFAALFRSLFDPFCVIPKIGAVPKIFIPISVTVLLLFYCRTKKNVDYEWVAIISILIFFISAIIVPSV